MKFGLQKEGLGISKNEKPKSKTLMYFVIYFRRFWKLMGLNMLFLVICLPVVTIGPANAAMAYILRKYSQEETAYVWKDFWQQFKENFKQGLSFGLISLAAYGLLGLAFYFYVLQAQIDPIAYALAAICGLALVVLTFISYYAYLLMVTVKLPLTKIIRNSLAMALGNLGANLLAFAINLFLIAVTVFLYPVSLLLVLILIPVTCAYTISFLCYPKVKAIFVDPQVSAKEQIPAREAIFKDTIE